MSSGADIVELESLLTLKWLDAGALTLLLLEYLATLPLEVALIWPTKISFIKVLYYLNRHIVFISVISPRLANSPYCKAMSMLSNYGRVATVLVSESLLAARVWALAGSPAGLGWGILGFASVVTVAAFGLMTMFALSAEFGPSPVPSIIVCFPTHSEAKWSTGAVALIFLIQIVLVSLSFYYGIRDHGKSGTRIGRIIYRDGLMYFVALTLFSTVNAALQLTLKSTLKFVLNTFMYAMHSILCTRMILHLRKGARSQMGLANPYDAGMPSDTTTSSGGGPTIRYAHSIELNTLRSAMYKT